MILASGVFAQLVLGAVYAWSEIALLLEGSYGFTTAQTQSIYGTAVGVFAFGTIVTGRLLRRIGPRGMTFISAGLFLAAYLLASAGGARYGVLLPTLGVLLGTAIAFGYVVPLSTATRWFPDAKGTVAGLAVMGFGGGAIVAAAVIGAMVRAGVPLGTILARFGLGGAAVLALAALPQRYPRGEEIPPGGSRRSATAVSPPAVGALLRSGEVWSLGVTMFLATVGGLIVIGGVGTIAIDLDLRRLATPAVSVVALGNASGRLVWGRLIDRLGPATIPASLIVMTVGFATLRLGEWSAVAFLVGAFVSGFQFGASLVVYGAFSERHFGPGAISSVYPAIFAFYGVAALVGPAVGGALHTALGSYAGVLIALAGVPVVALALFVRQFAGDLRNS